LLKLQNPKLQPQHLTAAVPHIATGPGAQAAWRAISARPYSRFTTLNFNPCYLTAAVHYTSTGPGAQAAGCTIPAGSVGPHLQGAGPPLPPCLEHVCLLCLAVWCTLQELVAFFCGLSGNNQLSLTLVALWPRCPGCCCHSNKTQHNRARSASSRERLFSLTSWTASSGCWATPLPVHGHTWNSCHIGRTTRVRYITMSFATWSMLVTGVLRGDAGAWRPTPAPCMSSPGAAATLGKQHG
jgi:hypothetical protein